MGTTFKQLYNKLESAIDVVPPSVCKDIINSALRDIYDERDWGFLWTESYIRTPALIEGSAEVTQFSQAIKVDSAIATLLNAITVNNVPLIERQFRVKSPRTQVDQGFIYNITNYTTDPGTKATGTIEILNPADGDTITINGVVLVFKNIPVNPNDVEIDIGFPQTTATNLRAVIAALNNPLLDVANYADGLNGVTNIEYGIVGEIGNTFTLVTSAPANIVLDNPTLIGGIDADLGTITIDQPYQDVSSAVAKIQIFKSLYTAPYFIFNGEPIIDFRRFAYVFSPQFNRRLRLDYTLEELNKRDPYRTYFSDPQNLVANGIDSAGNQLYEMYPAPKNERVLRVRYLRNGNLLSRDSDTIPDNIFSQELILARAKIRAYEWVAANTGKLDSIKSSGIYLNLIAMLNNRNNLNSYPSLLEKAFKKDEDLFPQAFLGTFSDYDYFDDIWSYYGFDVSLPHDSFGDTIVIDSSPST